eukprot:2051601-Amphidinium_carterae.2
MAMQQGPSYSSCTSQPKGQTYTTMAFGLGLAHCAHCAHISGDPSTHQRRVPLDRSLLHCWQPLALQQHAAKDDLQELQSFNAQCCNRRNCQTHWSWWQCWAEHQRLGDF